MMTRMFHTSIPNGDPGSIQTLQTMSQMVRQSLGQAPVVQTAARIVMLYPARDDVSRSQAIRAWLDSVFRFVKDPVGVELLRTPLWQLNEIQEHGAVGGDCDDAAILGAAIGMAVGIPARFRVLEFRPGAGFAHVYAILTPRAGGAIDLDVTKPAQGAAVPVRWKDFAV